MSTSGDQLSPSPARTNEASTQRSAERLVEFRELRERGALCTEVTSQFESEATCLLMDQYLATREYLADAATLLAEIATLEEPCLSQPGQRAPFPALVEQLSDSFDPQLCELYDRAFGQMITVARGVPAGRKLDAALNEFGLRTEADLLSRKAALRRRAPWRVTEEHRRVRKVLVLSRVTLGADVAVTSVVLQSAIRLFPEAERILLAPLKAQELFGGDTSLKLRSVNYASSGTLIERLVNWLHLIEVVRDELRGMDPHEYLLIDPDSRFLQLGFLPALDAESRYFFFESRSAGNPGSKSLSVLTAEWLKETFGGDELCLPHISLHPGDRKIAAGLCSRLRSGGASWIVSMSFGVGGNNAKRLSDAFEGQLIARMIEGGSTILLDQGVGEEERDRAKKIIDLVRKRGGRVVEIAAENGASEAADSAPIRCQMLTWQGGIGTWAGLIEASDEYIGYDSAGQHIAAALKIPTVDIFTAGTTQLFRQRWHPTGSGILRVIFAGSDAAGSDAKSGDSRKSALEQHALEDVMRAHHDIRNTRENRNAK